MRNYLRMTDNNTGETTCMINIDKVVCIAITDEKVVKVNYENSDCPIVFNMVDDKQARLFVETFYKLNEEANKINNIRL